MEMRWVYSEWIHCQILLFDAGKGNGERWDQFAIVLFASVET